MPGFPIASTKLLIVFFKAGELTRLSILQTLVPRIFLRDSWKLFIARRVSLTRHRGCRVRRPRQNNAEVTVCGVQRQNNGLPRSVRSGRQNNGPPRCLVKFTRFTLLQFFEISKRRRQ